MHDPRIFKNAPLTNPPGWLNLRHAFIAFANSAARFYSGRVFEDAEDQYQFPSIKTGDPGTADVAEKVYARLYIDQLCFSFASAARAGMLRTGYATKGGGEVTELPREWWRTDDPRLRFRTNSIDPDNPFSDAPCEDLPCWVFVRAADFMAVTDALTQWRKELRTWGEFQSLADAEVPDDGVTLLDKDGTPIRVMEIRRGEYSLWPVSFPDFEAGHASSSGRAPALRLVETTAKATKVARGKPGPDLDLKWKDRVYAYCKHAGRALVASDTVGMRKFHQAVKQHHGMGREEKPVDYRRTAMWRERWLDEQAGVAPGE